MDIKEQARKIYQTASQISGRPAITFPAMIKVLKAAGWEAERVEKSRHTGRKIKGRLWVDTPNRVVDYGLEAKKGDKTISIYPSNSSTSQKASDLIEELTGEFYFLLGSEEEAVEAIYNALVK